MTKDQSLYDAAKGAALIIIDMPKISLLTSMGLGIGTQIKVESKYPFGGPVLLKIENTCSIALGKDIAKQVAVQEVVA